MVELSEVDMCVCVYVEFGINAVLFTANGT